MGKPIAGRNKSPFGVDGIVVDAAVLSDGTKLTSVRISKQRSDNIFDLMSADGKTLYEFVEITGLGSDGKALDVSADASTWADSLGKGKFCIATPAGAGDKVGFITKFLYNKVVLQDGESLFLNK